MSKLERTIDTYFTHEIVIEKSRFITHLFPTDTVTEAQAAIKEINKLHYNATHNCSAYIIQGANLLQKANDDGEPQGTAGMPMLQSLINNNMLNVTAIVTRYFGGIKLGAGGLVRAYSNAVSTALDLAPLYTYTTFLTAQIVITYDDLNKIYHLRDTTKLFTIQDIIYAEQLTIIIEYLQENQHRLQTSLTNYLLQNIQLHPTDEAIRKTMIIF